MEASAYGDPISSDPPGRARARLRQAHWRVHELGIVQCHERHRPDGTVLRIGSELPHLMGPTAGRANFLSEASYRYAMDRLATSRQPGSALTIQPTRLRFSMLSSQPMCFNLLSELRDLVEAGDARGTAVVQAMFPEAGVETVQSIVVEAVPTPIADYLDDKTGWDAAITINAGSGLITIETKYTDPLARSAPQRPNPARAEVARRLGLFTADAMAHYAALGARRGSSRRVTRHPSPVDPEPPAETADFDQMGRNLLLTAAYADLHGLRTAVNYVLAPAFDTVAADVVADARTRLSPGFQEMARFRTLDTVVDAAREVLDGAPEGETFDAFHSRYLDLGPADALLARAQGPATGHRRAQSS